MNKLGKIFCLLIILVSGVFAQTQKDDYKRNEFFVGYINQQVNDFKRESLNGFEVSAVRNVHRYLGIKGDFSAAFRKRNQPEIIKPFVSDPEKKITGDFDRSLFNILGGIQIKNNASKSRFKPFAHALIGVAIEQNSAKNVVCTGNCDSFYSPLNNFTSNEVGLSRVFGGGLDVKVNEKIAFRAFQLDYNPVYKEGHLKNTRIGVGLVF